MTHTRYALVPRLLLTALASVLLLAGCNSGGDAVACEQAMRQMTAEGSKAMADGKMPERGTKPAECEGLSDAELAEIGTRVAGDFVKDELGKITLPATTP